MRKSRVHVESHPSLNSKILIPSSLFSPAATSNLLNCTRGSQLPRNSCTLCHHCSSSMKPSVLMGEGDLYCHDYHPMAALVDQSKLIWLDGILKEQPDGSHQSQSVHCRLWFTSCSQKATVWALKDDAALQSWKTKIRHSGWNQ